MIEHYQTIFNTLDSLEYEVVKDNKKVEYINLESGFDIETTSTKIGEVKASFMYIWQFGIGYGNPIYYGRTWDEFRDLINTLHYHFETHQDKRLVIYVHNLGYEFQFMRKYLNIVDTFAIDERKPLKVLTAEGIEFRDSYLLSNYSLANTAKNLSKHKVKKMVGDLDYSLIRTHRTPLTPDELLYCENDIQIILAYINEEIENNGDITKIPMTNTGRVRNYVRNICYYENIRGKKGGKGQYFKYRKVMEDLTLTPDDYIQLRTTFMGGFTHANALYSGKLLHDVSSIDFTSSYPSVMLSEKFPMTRFRNVTPKSLEEFEKLCDRYAVLFIARFKNLKQKIRQESYISQDKCRNLKKPMVNNGRIVEAEYLEVNLTETDYDIMKQVYNWDEMGVTSVKMAMKGYLPKPIIESVLKLYQDKTQLKDVKGAETEYMVSKGMLNSIYGMTVTDIVKDQSLYDDNGHYWDTEKVDLKEEINDYNESKNRFLYYAWGVWITAYARRNLWSGIIAVGDDYVYSDTDSLKILNYNDHLPYIRAFDSQIISKMKAMCKSLRINTSLLNPKTIDGIEKMIGVWDFEGTYQNFKTLGAKRYLTDENGKLSLTVAGLSKQKGLEYMSKMSNGNTLKIFEMFDNKLYVPAHETGKMTHTYIDDLLEFEIEDYLGTTAFISTESGVHLENCEYSLSLSDNYLQFLKQLSNGYIFNGTKHI